MVQNRLKGGFGPKVPCLEGPFGHFGTKWPKEAFTGSFGRFARNGQKRPVIRALLAILTRNGQKRSFGHFGHKMAKRGLFTRGFWPF